MTKEIRVVAILQAKPGKAEAVREVLQACLAPSRAEPGCRFYTLHTEQGREGRFVFIERWADRKALEEHQATAHFQALIAGVEGLLAEQQILILDEVPA